MMIKKYELSSEIQMPQAYWSVSDESISVKPQEIVKISTIRLGNMIHVGIIVHM